MILFAKVLPCSFTAGKHTTESSDDNTHQRETTDDVPPMAVVDLLRHPGEIERVDDTKRASNDTEHNAYPQYRHGEDTLLAKSVSIHQVKFHQVDEEEGRRNCPYQGGGGEHDVVHLVGQVSRVP